MPKPARIELARRPLNIPLEALSDAAPYELASQALQQGNLLQWRKLAKEYKTRFKTKIFEWRDWREKHPANSVEEMSSCADEAIETAAPLITLALVGVNPATNNLRISGRCSTNSPIP